MRFLTAKNIVTFVLLAISVFALLIFFGNYSEIYQALLMIRVDVIALILVLTLMNYFLRYLKWNYFLRTLDIHIPFSSSMLIFLSGLSMAITPGKVGEVMKSYLLKQMYRIKIRRSLMVVVSERLTDVFGLAALCLIGLGTFWSQSYFLIVIFALIFASIFVFTDRTIFFKLCDLSKHIPLVRKHTATLKEMYGPSRKLFSFKSVLIGTGISMISWFFECIALYILLINLSVPASLFSSTFIFSFSSIFGSMFVLPGGLGAAEGSFVMLLLLTGTSKAVASVATIVIRICTLFFGVGIGLVALYYVNRRINSHVL